MSDTCFTYITTKDDNGKRLDALLASQLEFSRARLQGLIREGQVIVIRQQQEHTIKDPSWRVKPEDDITLTLPPLKDSSVKPEDIALDILFEDESIIVINKAAGLVVHPAPGNPGGTLVNALLAHCGNSLSGIGGEKRPGIVHRLDKDTSGVLLLAKTLESARALTEAFHRHKIEKTYLAIVIGMPAESGKICAPLKKLVGKAGEKMVVNHDGQDATTLYRRIDHAGRKLSLMALRPVSGRKHQLRVHMQHINTPICGDGKYGGDAAHPGGMLVPRLHLHAWQVKLADGKVITAPLSPHFAASMEQLGLAMPLPGWRFQDQ